MYDLIIIGSGPAGLSAAVYGKRAGFNILVMEKESMSGGQILNTHEVDNYLGMPGMNGFDMGMEFHRHAKEMGALFKNVRVTGIEKTDRNSFVITTDEETEETKSIIIATGATHALLDVSGEERLTGRGVSYCATCDGAFFRNKTVAVVGGGDVAAEDAIFLSRICDKVYLIHRRDSLRAAKSLQDQLFEASNVEVVWNSVVEEICGEEQVEELKVYCKEDDRHYTMAVDGIFIAVGLRPNTELVCDIVACDEGGYIIAGEDCVTNTPGIFAAGDVRTKMLRQIVTAAADGANAVASAERYMLQN